MDEIKEELRVGINKTVCDVLKKMALLEVVPSEAPIDDAPDTNWVSLAVLHPIQGEFILKMPEVMTKKITKAIFDVPESSLTEPLLEDSMAELLNTIVGRLMNAVLPKEQTFRLGLPKPGHGKCPKRDSGALNCYFLMDSQGISLTVSGETLLQMLFQLLNLL